MSRLMWVLLLVVCGLTSAEAQVVALGDSATRGYLLDISLAWPAKLEALLHKRGINVSVANAGINGDTSDGMLSRMDAAIPGGTRVVVLMCCGNDNKDRRHYVADHLANVRTLIGRLRARGVAVVYSGQGGQGYGGHDSAGASAAKAEGASWCGWAYEGLAPVDLVPSPAGTHPTPEGHDKIAARLLPCVIQALGQKRS
jgi:acyl-CoA thioesterase-1